MPCMLLTLTFIMLISIIVLFIKHPISLSILLLMKAILMANLLGLIMLNFWISYIAVLIMVGGLLILFLYMTNVASNEKFKFSKNISILILFYLLIMYFLFYFYKLNFSYKIYFNKSDYNLLDFNVMISKFFSYPFNYLMIIMFIFLLLTLIMSVKMTNLNKGPLRQKF